MTDFFFDTVTPSYHISQCVAHMHFFRDQQQSLSFHLGEKSDFLCAIFLDSSDIDVHFFSECEGVKARIFVFIPARSHARSALNVHTKLSASNAEVQVHLIAIQDEGAQVSMQGMIDIAS